MINRVYNCNNMEYMKDIPDNYFELCICDPPYGNKQGEANNRSRGKLANPQDYKTYKDIRPDSKYFKELLRISKNQIIWGGNYFISDLYDTECFIVWNKNNGKNDFADCELAWSSFKSATRMCKITWNGMLQEDMKNKEKRIHINQKPVALYRWLLKNYAKPGDKIFDSHVGSGSSRIACYELGFDFTGCELDKDYYEAQEKRFKLEKAKIDDRFYIPEDQNQLFKDVI
jgi:site-specific DNA-methyltransferase (adenine-specific)